MTAWPGWSDENTLILPLDDAPPTNAVEIDGRRFEPKGELHVTLVGTSLGRELRSVVGERLDAATRPAFEALDWSLRRTGHGAVIERACIDDAGKPTTVATIVEFVELPAMAWFHQWLGTVLGRELQVPPPHVTLYTYGRSKGIGISGPRALRAMARGRADLSALRPATG